MKVAYINPSQVPSQTANSGQVLKVCQALSQVNGPVCLWLPGNHPVPWSALAEQYGLSTPFEMRWLPVRKTWRNYDFAWQSVNQAKTWGAQLVYTRALQVADMALIRGMPVILEQHLRLTGPTAAWLFRIFLRWPGKKRLLVITQALRKILEEQFRPFLRSEQVQVAPSGVDLERFGNMPDAPTARRNLGFPEMPTAVYTGSFYSGRGLELLFELARCFPSVNFLWIGGKAEEISFWQGRLGQAGIENLHLTGFIPNQRLPLYQAAADVLLVPYQRVISVSGGGNTGDICSPIKVFEYLASGRAIISSDLPVLHEVLNDRNAVFCPPDDVSAWSKALSTLLTDQEKRARLGEQALSDARQYTWKTRAQRAIEGF